MVTSAIFHSKTCLKCNTEKPPDGFYTPTVNECKECTKIRVRRTYYRNHEARLAYERKRAKLPHRIQHAIQSARRWRAANPERYQAHQLVSQAIRSGIMKQEPCEVCGNERVHAHHDDYSRPLMVRWLCPLHHRAHHSKGVPA